MGIQKITKLQRPESFLQINTIKGFTYIDRAGEILNIYVQDNKVPTFSMNLDGLIIQNPVTGVTEMKITPKMIWMRFPDNITLDRAKDIFEKEAKKILEILEVSELSRLGWRNYFINEFNKKEDYDKLFEKLNPIATGKVVNSAYKIEEKEIITNFKIEAVEKGDTQKTKGILFDTDTFIENKDTLKDLSKSLNKTMEYIKSSDGLLGLINNTLEVK